MYNYMYDKCSRVCTFAIDFSKFAMEMQIKCTEKHAQPFQ